MMSLNSKFIATSLALCALLLPIAAQAKPEAINKRWNNQQHRIDRGIKSGQLTPREAARLERREDRFRRQEHRYRKHDHGLLTVGEHRRLEREENHMSHSIYR